MHLLRTLRHLITTRWSVRRRFTRAVIGRIEAAIGELERRHAGEIRFAVEAALDLPELWRSVTPRERALQVFGHLGVWDTEANNGVLIYVLVADRDVEIVADRAIAARVSQQEWEAICRAIEDHFRAGRYGDGVVAGIRAVGELLGRYFPAAAGDADEQPNEVVLM